VHNRLDGEMKSPWEENSGNPEDSDLFKGERGNELLGQLLERSTSAPPLPSETNAPIRGPRYIENTESVSGDYKFDMQGSCPEKSHRSSLTCV
jgi:hypothetical protein